MRSRILWGHEPYLTIKTYVRRQVILCLGLLGWWHMTRYLMRTLLYLRRYMYLYRWACLKIHWAFILSCACAVTMYNRDVIVIDALLMGGNWGGVRGVVSS